MSWNIGFPLSLSLFTHLHECYWGMHKLLSCFMQWIFSLNLEWVAVVNVYWWRYRHYLSSPCRISSGPSCPSNLKSYTTIKLEPSSCLEFFFFFVGKDKHHSIGFSMDIRKTDIPLSMQGLTCLLYERQ